MSPAIREKLAELRLELEADKKKTAVLAALALVGLVLGVRWLAGEMGGPSRASAAETSGGPSGRPTALGKPLRAPELREPARYGAEDASTIRDPFLLSAEAFGLVRESAAPADLGPKSGEQGVEIAEQDGESGPDLDAIRALASELKLRSTMLGATPMAVFELGGASGKGRVVARVGEPVGGFTLVEVTAGGAVLELDGVRIKYVR